LQPPWLRTLLHCVQRRRRRRHITWVALSRSADEMLWNADVRFARI
jgi:hypothetical protein